MNNQEQKEESLRTLIKNEVFKNNSSNVELARKFPKVPKALLKRYRFDMIHQFKEYKRGIDEGIEEGIKLWKTEMKNEYQKQLELIHQSNTNRLTAFRKDIEWLENIYHIHMKNKTFDIVLAFLMGMSIGIIIIKIWN